MTQGRQPCPPASCSDAVRQAAENLTALCEDLNDAPPGERLSALAALHRRLRRLRQCAQREAITTVREQGWPLRRIAAALNCSHEQVRIVIAGRDPRGGSQAAQKAVPSGISVRYPRSYVGVSLEKRT